MEFIDILNRIAKLISINFFVCIIFIKLINYKFINYKKYVLFSISSIIIAVLCILLSNLIPMIIILLIIYSLFGILIAWIIKYKTIHAIIITLISLTIEYLIYFISIIISGITLKLLFPQIELNNILNLLLGIIIEVFIIYRLFKIPRLKHGVAFLQNQEKTDNIGIIGIIMVGLAIFIYSIISKTFMTGYILVGVILETIAMSIWIFRKLTKYYKQKLKEQTIEELENEIKEKDEKIKTILEENNKIATINHKYSSRISALEKISNKILTNPVVLENMKTEFGEEFGEIQTQIENLSKEFTSEVTENIKHNNNLPKTGIFGIDNLLKFLSEEAAKDNITLNLKINGSINYMVENIIPQNKLETLLADHIKDAIIAIKSSNNTYRNILVIIGIVEDFYEVCIYDTGIEFEIDTLLKLGLEQITTHKETGGSGIGFITTFETLKETKASLIIEEKHPESISDFTKAVRIRFDGKQEYKIRSYRIDQIKEKTKDDRIILEENK